MHYVLEHVPPPVIRATLFSMVVQVNVPVANSMEKNISRFFCLSSGSSRYKYCSARF